MSAASGFRRQPNFLFIGAEKAGSTAIHRYLSQHPEVFLPQRHGPSYFAHGDMDLSDRYGLELYKYTLTLPAYQSLFDGVKDERAVGESSPSYLYSQRAPGRIQALLPDVKLIAVLRQPADRAFSHWLFQRKQTAEPLADFQAAMQAEPDRIARNWAHRFHYGRQGFYGEQLKRYYSLFPREQILVLLYDDLLADAQGFMRKIFEFLEVDPAFEPDLSERFNVSGEPRNGFVRWALNVAKPVRWYAEQYLSPRIVSPIGRILLTRKRPNPAILNELIEDYRADIAKTQELIGRDLSAWLRHK